jgi:hypothetical protein
VSGASRGVALGPGDEEEKQKIIWKEKKYLFGWKKKMLFYGGQSSCSSLALSLSLSAHRHWVMSFSVSVISRYRHTVDSLFFLFGAFERYTSPYCPVVWATWPIDPARYFHRNRRRRRTFTLFFVCVCVCVCVTYMYMRVFFWNDVVRL